MNQSPKVVRDLVKFAAQKPVWAGIIVGGVLGSLLGLLTLRLIRGPGEQIDPAELVPIRVVPPRPKSSSTAPTPSATVSVELRRDS
jgi:hypothetical protein